MAKKRKLKFGSPAWRAKYMKKGERANAAGKRYYIQSLHGSWGDFSTKKAALAAAKAQREADRDAGNAPGHVRVVAYKPKQNAPKRKKNGPKRKRNRASAAKRKNRSGIYNPPIKSRSTARSGRRNSPNKKRATKRRTSPVRNNPPRKWTKVKSVRVIRKGGKDVLQIRK